MSVAAFSRPEISLGSAEERRPGRGVASIWGGRGAKRQGGGWLLVRALCAMLGLCAMLLLL